MIGRQTWCVLDEMACGVKVMTNGVLKKRGGNESLVRDKCGKAASVDGIAVKFFKKSG